MAILFTVLVFILFILSLTFSAQAFGAKVTKAVGISLALWLSALGVLAYKEFFLDFSGLPPHIAFAVVPGFVFLIVLALYPGLKQTPRFLQMNPAILIIFQSFRILVEFILYNLVENHQLPEMMTFTGSNYDLAVGLTAPILGWGIIRYGKKIYPVANAWNGVAFLILLNTVFHGILAAPTRFQVFFTDPSNTIIGTFPWIWLPGFVVPLALAGHILSFKQLRQAFRTTKA